MNTDLVLQVIGKVTDDDMKVNPVETQASQLGHESKGMAEAGTEPDRPVMGTSGYAARMKIQPTTPRSTGPAEAGPIAGLVRRGALLAAAGLASATLISACGSSSTTTPSSSSNASGKKLDVARVQASIEESILLKRKLHSTVTCPASIEQRAGNDFTCYATGTIGPKKTPYRTPFEVTQVNNNGYVTYHS
jgi:hypothetical protein